MSNHEMERFYIKRLEKHVGNAVKILDNGGGAECPLGSDFPAIVTCLGGLELERLKNGSKKQTSGFFIDSKWGKVHAGGTAALVLILVAAIVILALERMRIMNLPVVGNARSREVVEVEKMLKVDHERRTP